MSDFNSSLRPPASPSGRASSPVGGMNPSRYSMGKMSSGPIKSPNMNNNALPATPTSAAAARGLRPSSEMIGMQHQGTPESDAIDKWFEDLQHYEATLEEMAAASLDQNFKEELSAIEQWFRVLSEAERTAALYSLLQESTQVQIRFFITVLQQMARSDPMSAHLSPNHPSNLMAEQMEAKFASLGLKSPSAAAGKSPSFRQSTDAAGYLSPNAAAMYGGNSEAAATLAAQRAKLKANRISAPGTLASDHAARNFSGGGLDQVQESRSPGLEANVASNMRPKSTDGLASAASKSPRPSGPLDDQLSPIQAGGNWSSMVNTPLMPMFGDENSAQANLDAAAAQLASVGQDQRVLLDQDISKYRRRSGNPQGGGHGSPHASPSMSHANIASSPGVWNASQNEFLRQAMAATSPLPGSGSSSAFTMQMSPNSLAGLQSPSGGLSNPMNMQMMNAMAAMGGLGNMSATQLLQMQQQILQNQQQIAAMAAGNYNSPLSASGYRPSSGNRSAGGGTPGSAFQNISSSAGLPPLSGRRSPASNTRLPLQPRSGGGQMSATNAGHGNEEDVADLKLLQDVPNWLRVLRLHKYTPNFENTDWKEIVVMSDKDLEAKGVAALGARRKMLKTFEVVRDKHGIPHPEGSVTAEAAELAEKTDADAGNTTMASVVNAGASD